MTISNSNLLSILSTSLDGSQDNMLTGQMSSSGNALSVEIEAIDQDFLEGDFWSMLNQQMTEMTNDDELQAVENKQLFSFLNDLPVEQKFTDEADFEFNISSELKKDADSSELENKLAVEWMHNLKMNISESDATSFDDVEAKLKVVNSIAEVEKVEIENTDPVVAALSFPGEAVLSKQLNGEKLPPVRQVPSVELPQQPADISANLLKTINKDTTSVVTENQSADLDANEINADEKFLMPRHADSELTKAEITESQKTQKIQPVIEQSGTVIKESAPVVLTAVSQLSTALPQNPINSPLSTSLQTMQLAPEATASQWGEALGERVSLLLNNKLNSAEIRIDPPHLGKLDIQIQLKDDSASIVISTQHAHTRDLIESASIRLREFLQESGYNSVDVDVSHQEQTLAQQDLAEQNQKGNSEQHSSDQSDLSELNLSGINLAVDDGRIDYFA